MPSALLPPLPGQRGAALSAALSLREAAVRHDNGRERHRHRNDEPAPSVPEIHALTGPREAQVPNDSNLTSDLEQSVRETNGFIDNHMYKIGLAKMERSPGH